MRSGLDTQRTLSCQSLIVTQIGWVNHLENEILSILGVVTRTVEVKGAPGFECQTRGWGGGVLEVLKKIYYSNPKPNKIGHGSTSNIVYQTL